MQIYWNNRLNHFSHRPVYGLNVNSMIKHETLVVTKTAVEDLTVKYANFHTGFYWWNLQIQPDSCSFRLLHALHTTDVKEKKDRNRTGPTELELKMEKYRPVLWMIPIQACYKIQSMQCTLKGMEHTRARHKATSLCTREPSSHLINRSKCWEI